MARGYTVPSENVHETFRLAHQVQALEPDTSHYIYKHIIKFIYINVEVNIYTYQAFKRARDAYLCIRLNVLMEYKNSHILLKHWYRYRSMNRFKDAQLLINLQICHE